MFVAHVHASMLALGLGALIYTTGAQTFPPLLLSSLVPVSAALIGGASSAMVWLGVTMVGLASLYALVVGGHTPMPVLPREFVLRGGFFGSAAIAAMMTMVAVLYEKVRLRRLRELEETHDVLERVRREQLELRDRFVSHVSHELRTPLSAMHMAVAGLLDTSSEHFSDEQRDYLDIAERNATQLGRMIADLTEMMRAETGKLQIEREPTSPVDAAERAVREQQAAALRADVSLRSDAEDTGSVLADPARVRQVLGNLIENAIKFSSAGGEVVVTVRPEPGDLDFVRLSVSDRGAGIAPEALDRIFDRLQQVGPPAGGPGGLGLGLAICRELVARHGGRIWAESELGVGSIFHFTLPRALEIDSSAEPDRVPDGDAAVLVPGARPSASVRVGR